MREAIRRALADPPPRGAVIVVAVGLLVTIAALALSRDPGAVGEDIEFEPSEPVPQSAPAALGAGGQARIVDGVVARTDANDVHDRLYRIQASLTARAGAGAEIESVRCQYRLPDGVFAGQSEGRRAAFPRPLADTADDAIKEGAPVEFTMGSDEQAGITLRNQFFKYVIGGDPSVLWSNLAAGQHTWKWSYPAPVRTTRDNFAAVLVARGGETIPIACKPEAQAGSAIRTTTVRTAVELP
jgi:hypothetical protein